MLFKKSAQVIAICLALSAFFPASAIAGGVIGGGGGGGTLPKIPVTASDVETTVLESKQLVTTWLNSLEYQYRTGCGVIGPLFSKPVRGHYVWSC